MRRVFTAVLLKRSPGEPADCYLGLLLSVAGCRVYGYVTNTHVKLLLLLRDAPARDEALGPLFRRLHSLYVDHVSNPFVTPGTVRPSAKFDAGVDALVRSFSAPSF